MLSSARALLQRSPSPFSSSATIVRRQFSTDSAKPESADAKAEAPKTELSETDKKLAEKDALINEQKKKLEEQEKKLKEAKVICPPVPSLLV